jgi:hypothetical protein
MWGLRRVLTALTALASMASMVAPPVGAAACVRKADVSSCVDSCLAKAATGLPARRGSGGGEWTAGQATYYTSHEGGSRGANGKALRAFESVAVPEVEFARRRGQRVELHGIGVFVVDDACAGGGCKDFDVYVGDSVANAARLPDWRKGVMPVEYRWLE